MEFFESSSLIYWRYAEIPLVVGIVVCPVGNIYFPMIRLSNVDLPVNIGPTIEMGKM
jgi:uncharacterized membrane-anchored protein YhcB (DUF1043 family)